jgi:hypothetical protein
MKIIRLLKTLVMPKIQGLQAPQAPVDPLVFLAEENAVH